MSSPYDTALQVGEDAVSAPLAEVACGIGRHSELIAAAEALAKRPGNVLGLLLRALTRQEIAIMEDRGCRADDWSLIQVAEDFDPFRVRRSHFVGSCVLGRFAGEVEVVEGLRLPTGIYDSTVVACQIGNNSLLEKVRFCANAVIEREAVLFDIGSLTCSGAASFACGQHLRLAIETGGRELPLWAEVDVPAAALIVGDRTNVEGLTAVAAAVATYAQRIVSPLSWVRRGAVVRHTARIRDAYIGPAALVDQAAELADVAVLSSPDEPTVVGCGAALRHSVLQAGVEVSGGAIVRHSVLCEHSGVDANAVVEHSLIGPNTVIAKGEVTSSLIGPFVGFHHQSMLIAAYWPEGKGNVAYGAMVGSNHTGRAPDQEIWIGEGCFFGLGCTVRFPCDLSEAPYSVIAAGAMVLAQRLSFPFSMVGAPAEPLADDAGVPRSFNELVPGWGIHANAYGIERAEMKFAQRDRSRHHELQHKILRPRIMRQVFEALKRLEAVAEIKPLYLDEDIPGIGKNFLREDHRQRGIVAYRRVLQRYSLRILLGEREGHITIPGSSEIAHELLDQLMPGTSLDERLRELVAIEHDNARRVADSKAADDERGVRIIPGYAAAHPSADADPVVRRARERAASTEIRVMAVLAE